MARNRGSEVSAADRLYQTHIKLSEGMILALAGQFKQWSHEPEKFR